MKNERGEGKNVSRANQPRVIFCVRLARLAVFFVGFCGVKRMRFTPRSPPAHI